MRNYFNKYHFIYQTLFSKLFSNFYLRNTKNDINLCVLFELTFRKNKSEEKQEEVKVEVEEEEVENE